MQKLASHFLAWVILLIAVSQAMPQSGRVKPVETPTPGANTTVNPPRNGPIYVPTQDKGRATPSPSPTPKRSTDDDDVIRVDSTLIPIPVSVTDVSGRAVTDLKVSDFILEVDGKKEDISDISLSQTPVKLALLFDNSSSVNLAREFEKKAALRFLNRVIRPQKDQAALFSVASTSRLEQPLTSDMSRISQAIEFFPKPEGATALLDGIVSAANYLNDHKGRRVIVIVSDGDDTLSDTTFEKTVIAVLSASCQIYVVKTTDFENLIRTGSRTGNANIRSLTAERRMQELASQTGGAVYSPIDESELNNAFSRISAELSEQYILNYYPEGAFTPGQIRSINVSVGGKPGLTVRARKGFYVPKGASLP